METHLCQNRGLGIGFDSNNTLDSPSSNEEYNSKTKDDGTPANQNLKTRRDVVYKTIIRMIKKHFRKSFKKSYFISKNFNKTRRHEVFGEYLIQYVRTINSISNETLTEESTHLPTLEFLIGSIIDPKMMKMSLDFRRRIASNELKGFIEKYYQC